MCFLDSISNISSPFCSFWSIHFLAPLLIEVFLSFPVSRNACISVLNVYFTVLDVPKVCMTHPCFLFLLEFVDNWFQGGLFLICGVFAPAFSYSFIFFVLWNSSRLTRWVCPQVECVLKLNFLNLSVSSTWTSSSWVCPQLELPQVECVLNLNFLNLNFLNLNFLNLSVLKLSVSSSWVYPQVAWVCLPRACACVFLGSWVIRNWFFSSHCIYCMNFDCLYRTLYKSDPWVALVKTPVITV